MSMPPPTDLELAALARRLAAALLARGWRLATAESCSGGWIAKTLTDLAGSSSWFEAGLVTYSNASKMALLGVAPQTLAQHGAVSAATVREMVAGAAERCGAELAVAVTGIAGPGGATTDKPVGTVWIGWRWPDRTIESACHHFEGDREAVRRRTVAHALQGLLARLEDGAAAATNGPGMGYSCT